MSSTWRRFGRLATAVLLGLALGFPALHAEGAGSTGNSRILGKITTGDGKTGVPGVTVLARHLSTEQVFSAVSDAKGGYEITDLPTGYYDMAVRTPEGLFVGDTVVNVAPARKALANFSIVPFAAGTSGEAPEDRGFPGSEGKAAGAARVDKKLTKREFWGSPKGVAILTAGGTAVLLAIVTGGSDERIVSAF